MSKREYRRFTAEQKIEILREADQPGVTVSEVCRRHGLSPSVLYRCVKKIDRDALGKCPGVHAEAVYPPHSLSTVQRFVQ
ncbi:MAG: transposase [Steroidobacteraceae bacterium]